MPCEEKNEQMIDVNGCMMKKITPGDYLPLPQAAMVLWLLLLCETLSWIVST